MKLILFFLITILISKRHKKDIYDRKPVISHYLADVQPAETRPESDYRHVYDPVRRVYTYAPHEYFGPIQTQQIGTFKVNANTGNVQQVKRKQKKNKQKKNKKRQ